jgi:hypothetical protein
MRKWNRDRPLPAWTFPWNPLKQSLAQQRC